MEQQFFRVVVPPGMALRNGAATVHIGDYAVVTLQRFGAQLVPTYFDTFEHRHRWSHITRGRTLTACNEVDESVTVEIIEGCETSLPGPRLPTGGQHSSLAIRPGDPDRPYLVDPGVARVAALEPTGAQPVDDGSATTVEVPPAMDAEPAVAQTSETSSFSRAWRHLMRLRSLLQLD